MLQEVALGHKSLADYTHIVGRGLIEQIRELAEPLQGKRVLHVSATAFGGGVSEILYTMVPLMRDVGLDAHWQVILGREEFFNVTKLMHNSLQGDPEAISDQQWEVFEAYNAMNAQGLEGEWDVIIIHDPQPAGLRAQRARARPALDLALPHRPLDARTPVTLGAARAADQRLRRQRLAHAAVRPGRSRRRHPQDLSRRRSTRSRRRTWRSRPRTPPSSASSSGSTSTGR